MKIPDEADSAPGPPISSVAAPPDETANVVCSARCGVALCDRRPLVSHDASTLFIPSGSSIRAFSLATGEPVRTLTDLHEAFVIALCPSPLNRVHVISCSVDGLLARWDSTDYAVISRDRILDDGRKIQVFLANRQTPWCAYVSHEKVDGRARNAFWLRSLTSPETVRQLSSNCSSNPSLFAIAENTDLVAWIDNEQLLCVVRCTAAAAVSSIRRGRTRAACIAVHPTDELVAVGDQDGAIFLHAGPFFHSSGDGTQSSRSPKSSGGGQQARAPAMKLHWHSLPVADLHMNGNFLYSAGAEGVLVRWDIESDDRQFLPRLGMPIKHITAAHNEKYVICSHSDNTLTVVQAPSSIHRIIQGMIQRGFTSGSTPTPADLPILLEPRQGHLVLSGRPGQLQFYSLEHDRQSYVLDVTGENLATDFKLQYELKRGINSEVILADFSPDGRYLATVEYKTALSAMCKLKFWRWNEAGGQWQPDTTALMPHLRQRPRALRMGLRDGNYFCVTAGERSFKLWTLVCGDTDNQLFWQCVDERSYRQLPCRALALSEDYSILAVAFGHMITVWHVDLLAGASAELGALDAQGGLDDISSEGGDLRLIGELCARGNTQEFSTVAFGRDDCSTILLAAASRSLSAWDMLSMERLWSAQVSIRQLLPDPESSLMAALVASKASRVPESLVIFRPNKTIETAVATVPLEQDDQIRCGVWVPVKTTTNNESGDSNFPSAARRKGKPQDIEWQSKSSLLMIGRRDKLFHFVRKDHATHDQTAGGYLDTHHIVEASKNAETLLSPFGVHLSCLVADGVRDGRTEALSYGTKTPRAISVGGASQRAVESLLQIPTHVMPSASIIAESFLKTLWLDEDDQTQTDHHRKSNTRSYNTADGIDESDAMFDSDQSDLDGRDGDDEGVLSKKARFLPETAQEIGALETLENEFRAEKLRLPKIKDYGWLHGITRVKSNKNHVIENGPED